MNDWWDYLKHSAKGSHWKEHKYVKIIDGVYYYPEGYMNGKYSLPDGKSGGDSSGSDKSDSKGRLKGWSKKVYSGLDAEIAKDPAFLDKLLSTWVNPNTSSVARTENLYGFLKEYAGIDLNDGFEDLSEEKQLEMVNKIYKHYAGKSSDSKSESPSGKQKLTDEELDQLVNDVIRGDYGNGQERKDKLGKYYQEIQSMVNEKLKGSGRKSSNKLSSKSKGELDSGKYEDERKRRSVGGKVKHAASGYTYFEDNYLMHYGMPRRSGRYPWGSGKEPYQSTGSAKQRGTDSKSEKDIRQENNQKDKAERKKRLTDSRFRRLLSKEDLNEKIKRLENEKRLRELTEEEMTPGQKFAREVFTDAGKKVVTTLLTGGALYGVKFATDGKFDKKEFAEALYYGGPKRKK